MFIIINRESEHETIEFYDLIMEHLVEFSMESPGRSWFFEEISSLLKQMPYLKILSLDLFSRDFYLIDGQQIHSLLSTNNYFRTFEFNY